MPSDSHSNTLIKIPSGVSFKFHSWGDEHIVYNSRSGNTHLVDELTYFTLQCVKSSLCDASTLYQEVANATNMHLDDELKTYLQQVLSQLAQNNLVELHSA